MVSSTRAQPEAVHGPDSKVVAAQVLEIAAKLVQAPAETERTILEWAFARIGALILADVVAVREIRPDGLVHYDAGWSRVPTLIDGPQPPMRLRNDRLDRVQISTTRLDEMPVVPDIADVGKWRGALDAAGSEQPQTVFSPLITGTEPTGFLCLVAQPGVEWDDLILQSFATTAALLAQFRARVRAELALQRQLAFSNLLRTIAERLLGIVPGEEGPEIEAALREIGEFLDVVSIGLWEVRHNDVVALSHRWLASSVEGTSSPDFTLDYSEIPANFLAANPAEPLEFAARDLTRLRTIVDDVKTEREFLYISLSAKSRGGALIVGSRPGRKWKAWEQAGLTAFASHLPTLRARLEVEEQLVAAFHAAPIGIVIRDASHRLVDCNQAFATFLGHSTEVGLLGTNPADILASDFAIDFANDVAARSPSETEPIELPFRHTNGQTIWGRLTCRRMNLGSQPMVLSHVEDVTLERESRMELQHRALHDDLTGVANRRHMLIHLERLMRTAPDATSEEEGDDGEAGHTADAFAEEKSVAVLLLDLDGFKQVNDQFGHLVGDRVLQEIACRIVGVSRDTDLVVRLGGDEFVVVLPGPIKVEHAQQAASRIREAVAKPMTIDDIDIRLTVSIGTAVPGRDVTTIEQLLTAADQTMYDAKAQGSQGRTESDPVENLAS